MNIEQLRDFCLSLPSATEEIKNHQFVCFCIGSRKFCVYSLTPPTVISIKVLDSEFTKLCELSNIRVAKQLGDYNWIAVQNFAAFDDREWEHYLRQSYKLIREKLPQKIRNEENIK